MEKPAESTPQVSVATTRAIFSHDENIFKDLENDISQANFISFDALVFTNETLGNALKKAKNNGAQIEGTLGTHHSNKTMQNFFDKNDINVEKKSQNHLKRFLLSEKDPNLGSPGKHVIIMGSANPTNYAYRNVELYTRTENDKPFFMQHFKDHTNVIKNTDAASEKQIVKYTPQKENKAFGSYDTMLSASKALRVQKLINSKNEQRMLYISSMTWNSPEMTQVLIDAQKNDITIRLILDKSALTGKGKEQVAQMHNAHIPIYIYDPGENSRNIQHSKVMLRIDGTEYLVINSTANMTPEGDKENNVDSYYPESETMGKTIKYSLDKLIMSDTCKTYEQAITLLAERENKKESQVKKRLYDDAESNENNDSHKKVKTTKK